VVAPLSTGIVSLIYRRDDDRLTYRGITKLSWGLRSWGLRGSTPQLQRGGKHDDKGERIEGKMSKPIEVSGPRAVPSIFSCRRTNSLTTASENSSPNGRRRLRNEP
jgi:hypothetical protein